MERDDKSSKLIRFPGPGRSAARDHRVTKPGMASQQSREHHSTIPGQECRAPITGQTGVSWLLASLHPTILAVLVARDRTWELFERHPQGKGKSGILERIPLTDLLEILEKSAANALAAQRAATRPVLQAPEAMKQHPAGSADRITLSPWKDFDLALMLRNGKARFALVLEPGTSIYVAEDTLPAVASVFVVDEARS